MNRSKNLLWVALAAVAMTAVLTAFAPSAIAQIRAAWVRDADAPTLQPFHGAADISMSALNQQALITTVPAGKRLVIEHISWLAGMSTGTSFVFAGLRAEQFGPFRAYFQIAPPHAAATNGFALQDGSQPVRLYFDDGDNIWLSATTSNGAANRTIAVRVSGYYVDK